MTSPWTWGLVAIAIATLACSWHVPRAWRWIGLGGLSFFASTAFLNYSGRPDLHPFFTFGCDTLVCCAIAHTYFKKGGEDWELGVFIAFMCSSFASILFIGLRFEQWVYASLLEICNLAALLWIAGTGVVDRVGRHENSAFHPVYCHLHRTHHPF